MRFFVLPIFDGVIMDVHPIFWVVDAGATTPRQLLNTLSVMVWSGNGWTEIWPKPMKFLVDMLNHAHWLRISNQATSRYEEPVNYWFRCILGFFFSLFLFNKIKQGGILFWLLFRWNNHFLHIPLLVFWAKSTTCIKHAQILLFFFFFFFFCYLQISTSQ